MILIRRVSAHDFKQLGDVDLRLPRRGRFLVRGLNEAGKSTLFEAIFFALFGRPLTTETGHSRLDDVIRYGADEAQVSLDVELARGHAAGEAVDAEGRAGGLGRILRVRRTVRRSRPNHWELDIVAPDGTVEEVRGNRVVNERIESELGLDGDALLNTCFVEQKKLEKLEGMSRAQREQSLMRLFNLDRLLEIGDELKVRHADEAAVARLRRRADLADLQARIPDLRSRHDDLSHALERAESRDLLRGLSVRLQDIERSRGELAAARGEAERLQARAAAADRALAASVHLREARTARDRALGAEADVERTQADLRLAEEARAEEPRITARGRAIGRLKRRHVCMLDLAAERQRLAESVAEADARLVQLAKDREALNDVRRSLVDARAAGRDAAATIESLSGDARAFDVRDALRELQAAQLAQTTGAARDDTSALAGATATRDDAMRRRMVEAAATAAVAVALAVGAMWQWPLLVASIALLAVLAWRWLGASRRIDELTATIGRLEGEAAVRDRERLSQAAREEAALDRLRELNAIAPATPERAQEALRELERRLGDRTRADVVQEITAAREAAEKAAARSAALSERESELARRCAHVDGSALGRERDEGAARSVRIGAFLARREPRAQIMAQEEGVSLDAAELEQELGALRLALRSARETARKAPDIEAASEAARSAAETHWRDAETGWAEAEGAAGAADAGDAAGTSLTGLGTWSRELPDSQWDAAAAALDKAYEAAGGDSVRSSAEAAAARASSLAGGLQATETAYLADLGAARSRVSALSHASDAAPSQVTDSPRGGEVDAGPGRSGVPEAPQVPEAPTADELEATAAVLELEAPEPVVDLAASRDAALAELTSSIGVADRLASDLGLSREQLDAGAEARRRDRAAHELAVRRRAAEIVGMAGRNVMQRVLPQTIQHMRGLLPRLTEGRYFDVQLSDDYRIEVYDDRAQGWKKKAIFSGGTRDQMSLTLRLAFALATLPEERGARPGFLFLDEPLGAFDDRRAAALIGLLTEGEIADSFDQVFLISHVRVDESLFDYRISMADGRITSSNLPDQAEVAT